MIFFRNKDKYLEYINQSHTIWKTTTVEPRFNEPLFNEVLDITNNIICYSKMYGIEPPYNEPSI